MEKSSLHTVEVCTDDFDQHHVYNTLISRTAGQVGAVVTFVGLVRDSGHVLHRSDGSVGSDDPDSQEGQMQAVDTLTLEHYPGMTESSIEAIVEQARERWPLLATHVIHRVGELQAGDQIVLVAVASAHRAAAFSSAEFIMDYLKTDAVFWKKEAGAEGTRWIESTSEDRARQQDWKS